MTAFVIQNTRHFLKINLKQGSWNPPLFFFAFTCPPLEYFLKNHSEDCEKRMWYLTLLESRPSNVLLFCLQIITANWMGTEASPKKYFYFLRIIIPILSEKTLMLKKIEGRRRGDDRRWDGWMASWTQWTWVWINSGSGWWTGRPGVLQSLGSQSRKWLSDWTERNYTQCQAHIRYLANTKIPENFGRDYGLQQGNILDNSWGRV